ncbi:RHS repeat protein [Pseudomonas gingeri]|uniref:RHS repeat protein n=1 Tax=Pseudomonas gingeri TaxID=117681 RepID=UPI0035272E01
MSKTFTYDGLGRKTFESDPGATTGTGYQYDALNRITRLSNADGTFQTRSYGPATTAIRDERGNTTTSTYRAYGDPNKPLLMAISAPDPSANVGFERAPNGQVTDVTQAGFRRVYGYDSHNYLTSVFNPETGTTVYGRDIAGNMISKQVGPSGITRYTYDSLNRLTASVYPGDTPAVTNLYNKNNKLLSSTSTGGSRGFSYDPTGNLTEETLSLDSHVFSTRYAYNGNDQLSAITYPYSGKVVSYAPDVLGRPTSVSGYISNVSYWPSGLIRQITYNNGTVTTYGQNTRLWPSSFSTQNVASGTYQLNSAYTYDGIGNLTSISDSTDAAYNRALGYDGLNRVVSVTGPWGAGNMTYDGTGNLTSQTLGTSSLTYAYNISNHLTSVTGMRNGTYGYDAYANVISGPGSTYSYNGVPNLVCVNCLNALSKVEYSYDGLNQRSAVTKAGGKSYEMYDSSGKQLIELSAGQLTEYIYLGGKRIAQRVSP